MALSPTEGEVYGEISPIPSSELEMLKLILTPYEGEILHHDALGEKAVVQFPNRQALEAIQEIPTYRTVEIPKPAVKEEDQKALSHSRDHHQEEEEQGEKRHKDEEKEEESHSGVSLKGEEAHVQKDDSHGRHPPAEDSTSTVAAASRDSSRPVSTSPVSSTAGAPSPAAAQRAEETEKKNTAEEEERKRKDKNEEEEKQAMMMSAESQTLTKRKALPSDDLFYLFADANILAPTWCMYLICYAVLAVFGVV